MNIAKGLQLCSKGTSKLSKNTPLLSYKHIHWHCITTSNYVEENFHVRKTDLRQEKFASTHHTQAWAHIYTPLLYFKLRYNNVHV